ncbi:efflux RND transporter periplasmic adaptor subunit [Zhongshania guokunii]|uniref:Efflux RND transporter periplasmic adaptor subunit n=1 Tax=Zhongshania guokunii TaxID=641783 RepID=A0ABV3UAF7_9GAMM
MEFRWRKIDLKIIVVCFFFLNSGYIYSFECGFYNRAITHDDVTDPDKSCFVVGERHSKKLSVPVIAESNSQIPIVSKLTGYISDVFVKEGDRVNKGDNLVLIDDPSLNESQAAAYRNLLVARGKYSKSLVGFERVSKLFKDRLVSKDAYEVAELDHQISLAEYTAANTQYDSAKKSSSYSLIKSPFDGLVRSMDVKIGELALYGSELLVLTKVNDLVLRGWVPASYISEVVLDGMIDVEVAGVVYSAEVEFISDYIDVAYQSVEMKLRTNSKIINGMSGMYGTAILVFKKERFGGYLVPKESVVLYSGMRGVFVRDQDLVVSFRWIDPGNEYGEMVEVMSGLNAGDVIVY